jgi:hypothetical protein
MSGIFISYRRRDSQGASGRLADGLEYAFGRETIFRDVLAISPGADFVQAIETALASCVVLLAVIGPQWLNIRDAAGSRRLDDPADVTRREIETALARGLHVIPVLVDGAEMPREQDLPERLKPLAQRQAHELTDKRWDYDLGTLIAALARIEGLPAPRIKPAATARTGLLPALLAAATVVVVGALYALEPLARWAGLEDAIPDALRDFIRDHARDGGTLLGVVLLVIVTAAMVGARRPALAAVLANPRTPARAVVVVTGFLVGLAILVAQNMVVSAGVAAGLAAAYLVAKRVAPDLFHKVPRVVVAAVAAFIAMGAAMWGDVAIERNRQSAYDVTFVMPPDGGHNDNAEKLFKAVKGAFDASLKDVETLKVVPEQISKDDFERYAYTRKDKLLDYDRKYGPPRIYIRSKYALDDESRSLSFLVTPYQRDAKGRTIVELRRWRHDPWKRPWSANETSLAALQAAFAIVSFLSSENLIRLTPDEQQAFRSNLLSEYQQHAALAENCPVKDELGALLAAGTALDDASVRRVLSQPCGKAPGDGSVAASPTGIDTVAAVYTALAR